MGIEPEIADRMKAIGADPTKLPISELYYVPFTSLGEEVVEAGRLSLFRFGDSPRIASVKLLRTFPLIN